MALAPRRLILGINCAYHESAAALVRDGEVIFAVEEERFTRTKHAKKLASRTPTSFRGIRFAPASNSFARSGSPSWMPSLIRSCLDAGSRWSGATRTSLTTIVDSELRRARRNSTGECSRFLTCWPARRMIDRSSNGFTSCLITARTPRAHSMRRRFRRAAVLVVDGIGEESTAWLGPGHGRRAGAVSKRFRIRTRSGCCGSGLRSISASREFDACKVMGLAAYGDHRRFAPEFDRLFPVLMSDGGSIGKDEPPFRVDAALARLRSERRPRARVALRTEAEAG